MMDGMEGMAECVWCIAGDGFVRIVGMVVFGFEACVMMTIEVLVVAYQWSL